MTNNSAAITIRLDKATHKRFKLAAVEADLTFKDIFVQAMEALIAKQGAGAKEESEERAEE